MNDEGRVRMTDLLKIVNSDEPRHEYQVLL